MFILLCQKEKTNPPFLGTVFFFPTKFLLYQKIKGWKKLPLSISFTFQYNVLQKLHQEDKTHLADTASTTPSTNDLINTTEHVLVSDSPIRSLPVRLDSPKSSGQKMFSNMQFSFQDLKSKREKILSLMQSSQYRYGKAIGKRFLFQKCLYKIGNHIYAYSFS